MLRGDKEDWNCEFVESKPAPTKSVDAAPELAAVFSRETKREIPINKFGRLPALRHQVIKDESGAGGIL